MKNTKKDKSVVLKILGTVGLFAAIFGTLMIDVITTIISR